MFEPASRFALNGAPLMAIAGIWRQGEGNHPPAFTMLTTEPGPDVKPYHDRQIVVLQPKIAPSIVASEVNNRVASDGPNRKIPPIIPRKSVADFQGTTAPCARKSATTPRNFSGSSEKRKWPELSNRTILLCEMLLAITRLARGGQTQS